MIQDYFENKFLSQSGVHDMQDEPRSREKTISQYMLENPNGNLCSRCEDEVPGARGGACVCWRCTHLLAELKSRGYFKKKAKPRRLCPDCGGERLKGHKRCSVCAKKRKRELHRKAMKKRRSGVSFLASVDPHKH